MARGKSLSAPDTLGTAAYVCEHTTSACMCLHSASPTATQEEAIIERVVGGEKTLKKWHKVRDAKAQIIV